MRPINVAIFGPATFHGRILTEHFINKPNYNLIAINFDKHDRHFTNYGKYRNKFYNIECAESLNKNLMGLSGAKSKIDVLLNVAGDQLFVPIHYKFVLRHPLLWLKHRTFYRNVSFEDHFKFGMAADTHRTAADMCRRLIHMSLLEDQPELFIQNSSHLYYYDDGSGTEITEIYDHGGEAGYGRNYYNWHYTQIESASDLAHKAASLGDYLRHDQKDVQLGIYKNWKEFDKPEDIYPVPTDEDYDEDGNLALKPHESFFENSENLTRHVVLRSGNILTNLNVPFGINNYYKIKKTGFVNESNFNWIHYLDWCRLIEFCIHEKDVDGVLNAVSPNPISNADYVKTFRQYFVLNHKPENYRVEEQYNQTHSWREFIKRWYYPGILIHRWERVYGTAKTILLTNGANVKPRRVLNYGFNYKFGLLDMALDNIKKKSNWKWKIANYLEPKKYR